MKLIWDKLSLLARYYIVSLSGFFLCWGVLSLLNFEFYNIIFFLLSYVWHFALMTPGLKERVMTSKQRFSFLNVAVRVNYYLQLFIKIKSKFGTSLIRAISPLLFTFILMVATGNGNILFTLLGSLCFEVTYYLGNKKIHQSITSISMPPNDPEMPPAIPSAESFHE